LSFVNLSMISTVMTQGLTTFVCLERRENLPQNGILHFVYKLSQSEIVLQS